MTRPCKTSASGTFCVKMGDFWQIWTSTLAAAVRATARAGGALLIYRILRPCLIERKRLWLNILYLERLINNQKPLQFKFLGKSWNVPLMSFWPKVPIPKKGSLFLGLWRTLCKNRLSDLDKIFKPSCVWLLGIFFHFHPNPLTPPLPP